MSVVQKLRKVPLAQHFIDRDRNRIREIETSQLVSHGDPHAAFGIIMQKFLGKSLILAPENKVSIVGILCLTMDVLSLGREIKEFPVLIF